MHYYFYLSKVEIRKNVLKYSNKVKILCYIRPLVVSDLKHLTEQVGPSPWFSLVNWTHGIGVVRTFLNQLIHSIFHCVYSLFLFGFQIPCSNCKQPDLTTL